MCCFHLKNRVEPGIILHAQLRKYIHEKPWYESAYILQIVY